MPTETQSKADSSAQSTGQSTAPPQASTNQAAAPTEGQTGRTRTQAEFDKMQSKKDTEIRNLRTSLRAAETRVSDLEDTEASLKDKLVSLQSEVEQGVPADAKEYRSQLQKREDAIAKRERDFKKERSQWDADLAERDDKERKTLAESLADKYGVDVDALLGFEDPKEMKAYALDNMDPTKLQSASSGESSTSTKAEGQSNIAGKDVKPDPKPAVISATSAGGEVSDAQFWKQYGTPGYVPTAADHKRAKDIRDKTLRGG